MEVEDEAESRRKLDEKKKKLQTEIRDVDRLSFVSKEMQESVMESLQHQLQDVEKRRHDLMLEHQKVQKRSQRIQSTQKENAAAEEEVQGLRDEVKQKEERILFLSVMVEKKDGGCRHGSRTSGVAGRRREKRQQCFADWRQLLLQCVLRWVQTRSMPLPMLSSKGSWKVEQFRGRCQEEMKEEGIVKMNKSKTESVSSWCYQRQAGSLKVHRLVVWSLIFLLFGEHLAKAEVQEDQAHKGIAREVHPDLQDGTTKEELTIWEDWCIQQKKERKHS